MNIKMNIKNHINIGILLLLLFVIYILFSMYSKKPMFNISKQIENENMNDITLTIYHMSPYAVLFIPISSVEDFIQRTSDEKIVINGSDLEEYIDLFKQVKDDVLIPVKKRSSYLGLRMYYVFESKKNGKLFDVAMWGEGNSMFVNDIEVKETSILYDVIIPFLPEDEAKCLKEFKTHNNIFSY